MRILTPKGVVEADLPSAEARALVAGHWSAIGVYVRTGSVDRLRDFDRLRVGEGLVFETDPDAIDRFWSGGELDFLEVYT